MAAPLRHSTWWSSEPGSGVRITPFKDVERQFALDDPDVAPDQFGRVSGQTEEYAA